MNLRPAFEKHVQYSRGVLRVREDLYQLDACSRILTIAFGALAHEMTALLAEQLGPLATGIISAPVLAGRSQLPSFRYFHAGEPLPNPESQRAAEAILKSLASLDSRSLVIYLISSGSSFVESPIDEEMSIDDMAETYKLLSQSSALPSEAKAILKHLSAVKGGRMALAAGQHSAQQVSLFAAPPGEMPASIACGPTLPDPSAAEDCYRIAARYALVQQFPASVRELFERRALEETPDKDDPAFHNCRWWPIIE